MMFKEFRKRPSFKGYLLTPDCDAIEKPVTMQINGCMSDGTSTYLEIDANGEYIESDYIFTRRRINGVNYFYYE